MVADPVEAVEHRIFGKWFVGVMDPWKNKPFVTVENFHSVQDGDSLF